MTWDEYRKQVTADVRQTLDNDWDGGWMDAIDLDERTIDPSVLSDDLWADDDVTGNGSGSYTFCREVAERNVAGVIWSDGFADMLGGEWELDAGEMFKSGPEAVDVTIRCYLLGEACDTAAREWAPAHGFAVV